jgi:hypothetical protein
MSAPAAAPERTPPPPPFVEDDSKPPLDDLVRTWLLAVPRQRALPH